MSSRMLLGISVIVLTVAATARAESATALELEAAAKLFGLKGKACSNCHTLGKGDKTGPDLKGVTARREKAWAQRFINAPGALIDAGDKTAVELFQKYKIKMDNQNLTEQEFELLWGYWSHCDGLSEACQPDKWATDATPEEIQEGESLFLGTKPLANGGPSCIGCHNVRGASVWGGGSLGPDLTFIYARLGEDGLAAALEEASTPVMKAVYGGAPLVGKEQEQLKAYFADVARDGAISSTAGAGFLYLGLEGMGVVVALALILRSRKRGKA